MNRKVVQQGASTLMISLPSKWVKQQNLKKGEEISLEEVNNTLVISRERSPRKLRTTVIITSNNESAVRTAIVNTYRTGYDLIEIAFQTKEQYQMVVNTIKNYLIGFEVIQRGKTTCLIENITEPSPEQFEVLLRKMLYNIVLLMEHTEKRLRRETTLEDYKTIVLTIHQYDNFCRRVIAKQNQSGIKTILLWTFLVLVIHGQRELYHLNQFLDKQHHSTFHHFSFFTQVKEIFGLLKEGYIKRDRKLLEKIHELEKKIIYHDFYGLVQKNQKEIIVLYHLATAAKNFYLASSPLQGYFLEEFSSEDKQLSSLPAHPP